MTHRSITHPSTIGGSDVAAILGASPYATPWDVWARCSGVVVPQDEDRPELRRGHALEPWLVGEWVARRRPAAHRLAVQQSDPERPWARGEIDAMTWRADEGPPVIAECKTDALGLDLEPDGAVVTDWLTGVVPIHWLLQIAWYSHLSDARAADLVVGGPRYDVRIIRLERDDAVIRRVVQQVEQWYQRHVIEGLEPERTEPAPEPVPVIGPELEPATTEDEALLARYKAARDAAKAAAVARDEARDQLAAALSGRPGVVGATGRARWVQRAGRRSLDLARLRDERPDVIRDYEQVGEPTAYVDVR